MPDNDNKSKIEKVSLEIEKTDKEFVTDDGTSQCFSFLCDGAMDIIQTEGEMLFNVVDDVMFITAQKGTINMMAGDNGDGKLKLDCDKKKLSVQSKEPAFGEDEVVSISPDAVGCKHHPAMLYDKGKAVYNMTTVPPSVTLNDAWAMISPFPDLGLKVEALIKKEVKVDHTFCKKEGEGYMATVGDTVTIKHKFKGAGDVVPPCKASMVGNLYAAGMPQPVPFPWTTTKGKVTVEQVPPATPPQAPAWNPMTFFDAQMDQDWWMSQDAPAGDEVDVDKSIQSSGASTSVFCEDKAIALKDNHNMCVNDSMAKEKCLMIK
ncbi:MAG TPA: hypothetical protein DCO86_00225 [Spirochaetaceae bacterium]|nr:hypothetical protein [Spirochaetaceae bacterium]